MTIFSKEARELIKGQISEWDLAANNYKGLKKVKVKALAFNGHEILVQFNPERIRSSAAKVDAKSIEARPCFLCAKNLPAQQRGLEFGSDYTVLVNPFPIFPEHLTIPKNAHNDQRIRGHFEAMLDLAKELDDFTVFYNGPKCGASAPDHFHFQAGIKGFLPIENEFKNGNHCKEVGCVDEVSVFHWEKYLRGVITLKSKNKASLAKLFYKLYDSLEKMQSEELEPMLNILASMEDGTYVVHVFPRKQHRPSQFFAEGEAQFTISPASVDMGGVFITPREEDFNKIDAEVIQDIFNQVCYDDAVVMELIRSSL
ncbi:DUF4922 domain-containing protein [Marinilabiliaceae bacterium JC017]|nr:DUF4922 domain-containing protein [Marinilabiliaceae bacterium JC017]